jgi:2-polyprenyl-6-methoxyphenol hydroxylase-like FAD-dependent oxidoreductase
VLSLLMAGLFAATDEHPAPSPLKIEIRSINSWVMHAQVARAFSNDHGNVFLVGDSAHRFPPAGGFGMNTGLQDAHNLAWKLAWVLQGRASEKLLSSYESGLCLFFDHVNLFFKK